MTSPFDDPRFNRTLFFPRPDDSEPPPGAEDLAIDVAGGDSVHVRIHVEEGVDGLLVESGFADPLGLLRRRGIVVDRIAEEDARRYDNARKIAGVRCPVLVIHGAEDDLLRPEEGTALHAAAGAAEKRLALLPGVGHNDILYYSP